MNRKIDSKSNFFIASFRVTITQAYYARTCVRALVFKKSLVLQFRCLLVCDLLSLVAFRLCELFIGVEAQTVKRVI